LAVWLPRFKLNCHVCSAIQKKYRGCESKAIQPFILDIDGKSEELERCPLKLITETTIRIINYYYYFKDGFLPSNGGIDNQSVLLLEAFDIIDIEKQKVSDKDAGSHKRYAGKTPGGHNRRA